MSHLPADFHRRLEAPEHMLHAREAAAAIAAQHGAPAEDLAAWVQSALSLPDCDRLREWAAIGPVQLASVESLAEMIQLWARGSVAWAGVTDGDIRALRAGGGGAPSGEPAEWSLHFSDERDFCRFASILIGAPYCSGKEATARINNRSAWGERTHGSVTTSRTTTAPAPLPPRDQFDKLIAELDAADPAGMAKAREWAAAVLGAAPLLSNGLTEKVADKLAATAEDKRRCYTATGDSQYLHESGAYDHAARIAREPAATASVAGQASPAAAAPEPAGALRSEALLHSGKCRTWAAKLFNDPPDAALCVEAGDRLLYAAQLLDRLAAHPAPAVAATVQALTIRQLADITAPWAFIRSDHSIGIAQATERACAAAWGVTLATPAPKE